MRDIDEGVEIALSSRSGEDLENRFIMSDSCSSSSPSLHESSDSWAIDDEKPGTITDSSKSPSLAGRSRRSRFRRLLFLGLLVLLVCIIATAVVVANNSNKNKKNKQVTTASSLEANPETMEESNPESDPPSEAPQGSVSPSAPPSVQETKSPTLSPTIAVTTFRPIKSRYSYDETITFMFSIVGNETQPDDWIGIYPADIDSSNLQGAEAFLFLCNQLTLCDSAVSAGQVSFGNSVATEARLTSWRWPLEPGMYKAYVLRGFQAPFEVLAETSSFTIEQDFFIHTVVPSVRQLRRDIRSLILEEELMGPKFVRLGFHDCTGGCDGCVDMTFADNAGLEVPIEALQPIVEQYENPLFNISRADIWALAALVGADVAQERSETKVDFTLEFIGRKNCEDRFTQCFDQDGNERECSATLGPHVHLPEPDITTQDIFHFFNSEFGFNVRETVALMGAHTLGVLNRTNSGFNGTNGWVRDHLLLDNDYYHELVGGEEGDDIGTLIDLAPPWLRFEIDNSDLPDIPDRPVWRAFPPAFDGSGLVEIFMLNADVRWNMCCNMCTVMPCDP